MRDLSGFLYVFSFEGPAGNGKKGKAERGRGKGGWGVDHS